MGQNESIKMTPLPTIFPKKQICPCGAVCLSKEEKRNRRFKKRHADDIEVNGLTMHIHKMREGNSNQPMRIKQLWELNNVE